MNIYGMEVVKALAKLISYNAVHSQNISTSPDVLDAKYFEILFVNMDYSNNKTSSQNSFNFRGDRFQDLCLSPHY